MTASHHSRSRTALMMAGSVGDQPGDYFLCDLTEQLPADV